MKKILIGCETSGVSRRAWLSAGFDAFSCDLLPSDDGCIDRHFQCDVREILHLGWDFALFHPECTYLAGSGLHWNKRLPGRAALTLDALDFVRLLMAAPIEYIAIENPVGAISTHIRKPDQIIQPYNYGHDASKKTCLWLKNLPPLLPGEFVSPRLVNGKPRWSNQTDSNQNKLPPSPDRWKLRSLTYSGIAAAMVNQWGAVIQ